jgi:hypothetical protein
MTSWQRGKENEQEGRREERQGMNQGDLGEQIRGGAKDLGGKIEQGLDNIEDTLTGRQDDLQGNDRNPTREAQTWTEHRGEDLENTGERADEWMRNRTDDMDRKL